MNAHNGESFPQRIETRLDDPLIWSPVPEGLESATFAAIRAQQAEDTKYDAALDDDPNGDADRTQSDAEIVNISQAPTQRKVGRYGLSGRAPGWQLQAAAAAVIVAVTAAILLWTNDPAPSLHAVLQPTELAANATGQAEITDTPSGFEITLDISGLPPAPPGSYYQAWLKGPDGALVTIGTFHARGGGQDIVCWSGVDPREYSTLTVTVQVEGAGAESSGKVLLRGNIEP